MKKLLLLPAIALATVGIAACSPKGDEGNLSAGNVADLNAATEFNSTDVLTDENAAAVEPATNDALLTESNGADAAGPADNAITNSL